MPASESYQFISFDGFSQTDMDSPLMSRANRTAFGDYDTLIKEHRPPPSLSREYRQVYKQMLGVYFGWCHALQSPLAQYISPMIALKSGPEYLVHTAEPFYAEGNVMSYIQNNPNVNKIVLSQKMAEALASLHAANILHESLCPTKIFVDSDGGIQLTEVGLSGRVHAILPTVPHKHWRFKAPEILLPTGDVIVFTKESDVYAFGRTLEEMYTEHTPLREIKESAAAFIPVAQGRYVQEKPSEITESMWSLIMGCCAFNALDRPNMREVVEDLSKLV